MARKGKIDKGKEDYFRHYEEAECSFLSGLTIEEVSKKEGISIEVLVEWSERYLWVERRLLYLGSPRGAAQVLREMLHRKVSMIGAAGKMSSGVVDEVAKISKALGQMDQEGLASAGKMEVIRDLARWVRLKAKGIEDYNIVSLYLQRYLQEEALR